MITTDTVTDCGPVITPATPACIPSFSVERGASTTPTFTIRAPVDAPRPKPDAKPDPVPPWVRRGRK